MRTTILQIKDMKQKGKRIPMLTAYDYATAKLIDGVGVPLILVGDSLGMVVLGYESTIPVTMDEMLHHTKAVVRGTEQALIIGDMPFMTYHASVSEALHNAARFIQEGGAQAVKLEGGEAMAETVRRIVDCGIPVMGHIGLTPQSAPALGGYRVQGKTAAAAKALVADAKALESAGCWGMLVECVPPETMQMIYESVNIICMSLGAGPHADGQLVIVHDMIGYFAAFRPKFVRKYCDLTEILGKAFKQYIADVKSRDFPQPEHCYEMTKEEMQKLGIVVED
jgi:3-methyl-2-oxobutanoate hydroxymethyltransferase